MLGIRSIERILVAWARYLCGMKKGVDENILQWFNHVERMEIGSIAKRLYGKLFSWLTEKMGNYMNNFLKKKKWMLGK